MGLRIFLLLLLRCRDTCCLVVVSVPFLLLGVLLFVESGRHFIREKIRSLCERDFHAGFGPVPLLRFSPYRLS